MDLEYRRGFMYGRAGNPTRSLLERTMADLEGGADARAFASGVAVAAGLFQAMPGGVVVMPDDAYHGNRTLLQVRGLGGTRTFDAVQYRDDAIGFISFRARNTA